MTETSCGSLLKHLVASLAGGLLAGICAWAFAKVLVGDSVTGDVFRIAFVGSGFLGILFGAPDYRKVRRGDRVVLLVAVHVFIIWLGFDIALAIKEALTVGITWEIAIPQIGGIIGFGVGHITHYMVLLPRFVERVDE